MFPCYCILIFEPLCYTDSLSVGKKSQEGNKNLSIGSRNSSTYLQHSRVALTPNVQGVLVTKERLLSTPKKTTENIGEYMYNALGQTKKKRFWKEYTTKKYLLQRAFGIFKETFLNISSFKKLYIHQQKRCFSVVTCFSQNDSLRSWVCHCIRQVFFSKTKSSSTNTCIGLLYLGCCVVKY